MKAEYTIQEDDFLSHQLFTASKSKRINKKRKRDWALLIIGFAICGGVFYFQANLAMALYFGLFTLATGLFYPKYFNWRYKKHYSNYIKEHYQKRFGETAILEINSDNILTKDKIGEGKINIKEIEEINETQNHFFIKISTGASLIIPKKEITNTNCLKEEFENIGVHINNELTWKWS